jgi:hypothetical protein
MDCCAEALLCPAKIKQPIIAATINPPITCCFMVRFLLLIGYVFVNRPVASWVHIGFASDL